MWSDQEQFSIDIWTGAFFWSRRNSSFSIDLWTEAFFWPHEIFPFTGFRAGTFFLIPHKYFLFEQLSDKNISFSIDIWDGFSFQSILLPLCKSRLLFLADQIWLGWRYFHPHTLLQNHSFGLCSAVHCLLSKLSCSRGHSSIQYPLKMRMNQQIWIFFSSKLEFP